MELAEASSASIPYPDATFERVCTVHTCYFWPDSPRDFAEIRRVLRPEGRLVLAFRTREDAETSKRHPSSIYRLYDEEELSTLAREAGFSKVELHRRSIRGRDLVFLCASP